MTCQTLSELFFRDSDTVGRTVASRAKPSSLSLHIPGPSQPHLSWSPLAVAGCSRKGAAEVVLRYGMDSKNHGMVTLMVPVSPTGTTGRFPSCVWLFLSLYINYCNYLSVSSSFKDVRTAAIGQTQGSFCSFLLFGTGHTKFSGVQRDYSDPLPKKTFDSCHWMDIVVIQDWSIRALTRLHLVRSGVPPFFSLCKHRHWIEASSKDCSIIFLKRSPWHNLRVAIPARVTMASADAGIRACGKEGNQTKNRAQKNQNTTRH